MGVKVVLNAKITDPKYLWLFSPPTPVAMTSSRPILYFYTIDTSAELSYSVEKACYATDPDLFVSPLYWPSVLSVALLLLILIN